MYVNVHMPYYSFNVIDPDGNILEITGNMVQTTKQAVCCPLREHTAVCCHQSVSQSAGTGGERKEKQQENRTGCVKIKDSLKTGEKSL